MNRYLLSYVIAIVSTLQIDAYQSTEVTIAIEHAKSTDQQAWGLMGKRSLPKDWGMLFTYPSPTKISLWSFNCHIDLAVAFMDQQGTILEISELKAHPYMMDPKRPVYGLNDIKLYPDHDPIVIFYLDHGLTSKYLSWAALETESNFFQNRGIQVGDRLIWHERSSRGHFVKQEVHNRGH